MKDINLIPAHRRARQRHRHKVRWWLRLGCVYLVVLSGVLASAYAVWSGDGDVLAQKLTDTESRIERTEDSIIKLRKQLARCRGQLQTNQIIQHQPDWSRLLLLIGEATGETVTLNVCRLSTLDEVESGKAMAGLGTIDTAGTTDAILDNRDCRLRLAGFARTQTDVSLFVLRMERLDLFTTVRLDKSRRETFLGEPAVAFTIACEL